MTTERICEHCARTFEVDAASLKHKGYGRWKLLSHDDRRDYDKAFEVISACCR